MIYLDNAATTKIDPEVLDEMMPYLKDEFGNAGTLYLAGRTAKQAVDQARRRVAEFLNAEPEQIVFTSGGTESNNMVFKSTIPLLMDANKTHLVTSQVEHASILHAVLDVCAQNNFTADLVGVSKEGIVETNSVRSAIRDNTGLVSVMYVNNETGSENPIQEIAGVCQERRVLFHTDCVQAAGEIELNVARLGCDFLSISSHKIHGPKGVGALFVKDRKVLTPLISGGDEQEFGLRGGTENVAGIVGFGKACELMRHNVHETDIHTSVLKQLFYNNLDNTLKEYGLQNILRVNGERVIVHGKILNLGFDGVDGETLLLMLDGRGVCVSAGSACQSHESRPSHVLTAMGIDDETARSSIRFSFSKYNTKDEVVRAAGIVAECVRMLRNED